MAMSLQRAREEGRELLSAAELAQMGGFSLSFVYRLITEEKLKAVRIEGTVRIPIAEADRLLTQGLR